MTEPGLPLGSYPRSHVRAPLRPSRAECPACRLLRDHPAPRHTWIPESRGRARVAGLRPAAPRSRPRPPAVPTRPFVVPKAAAGSSSPCWGRSWTCGASRGDGPRSSSRACRPAAGAPPTASRPAAPRKTARTGARAGRAVAWPAAPHPGPPEVTGLPGAPRPRTQPGASLIPRGQAAQPGEVLLRGGGPPEPREPRGQALPAGAYNFSSPLCLGDRP